MKSLIAIILLINFLFAEDNPSLSNIDKNAKEVSERGWKLAKEPLKKFITKNNFKTILSILKLFKSPCDFSVSSSKVKITDNKYYYILSYAKYLENKNRLEEALNIYKTIIENSKYCRTNNNFKILGLVFTIVTEEFVGKSIQHGINQNIYSEKQKHRLANFLKQYLIMDMKFFESALESEKNLSLDFCKKEFDNLLIKKNSNVSPKSLKEFAIKSCTRLKEKWDDHLQTFSTKHAVNDIELYGLNIKKEKDLFLTKVKKAKLKDLDDNNTYKKHYIRITVDTMFYSLLPQHSIMKLNVLQTINANKELIKSLSKKSQRVMQVQGERDEEDL